MTTTPIVFLDTETTGLHADRRPWDIGMIRREPDGTMRRLTIFISDVDLSSAELIGLKIGHFYDRHPLYRAEVGGAFDPVHEADDVVDEDQAQELLDIDECLYPEQRAAAIVERWTRGAHIVGAVPNFDTETLAAMLRRHGLTPAWHYHLIDIEALAMGWLHGVAARAVDEAVEWGESPDPELVTRNMQLPWKSDGISRACGVEPPAAKERHTAIGDASWAMRLYDRITGAEENRE